jgi:glycosyltransferase involved in cell wall biosynthesis
MSSRQLRRVAIIIDTLSQGGAERVAIEAAGALDRERYLPHLIVTRQSGPLEQLARERDIGVTILDRRRGFAPRKLERAFAIVRRSEVVHAHLWGSGIWGALLARFARRPFLAHAHRFDADMSRLWLPGYRYWIAPTAYRIVCVSNEILAGFRAGGVPAAKLAVVPNGVILGESLSRNEARAELGLPAEGLVVGMVARLRAEKRHDLALRSLASLRAAGRDVTLCIVGDGPGEQGLRRLANELGVEAAISWAGPRQNAGRLMRAFDVALITSTVEGMPLAALEALVVGVPLVSTPVGAMPDLLEHGGGTLVGAGEAEEISSALGGALDHRDEPALVRSQLWACRTFGIDEVARRLEQLYDAAIGASV